MEDNNLQYITEDMVVYDPTHGWHIPRLAVDFNDDGSFNAFGTTIKPHSRGLYKISPTWEMFGKNNTTILNLVRKGYQFPNYITVYPIRRGEEQEQVVELPTYNNNRSTSASTPQRSRQSRPAVLQTNRPRVTLTPAQTLNLAKIEDGKTYYTFEGYTPDQVYLALSGLSQLQLNNNYYVDPTPPASQPTVTQSTTLSGSLSSQNSQNTQNNLSNQNTQNNQSSLNLTLQSPSTATRTGNYNTRTILVLQVQGDPSDEAVFMYRYPRKDVHVYLIPPEIVEQVLANLLNIKASSKNGSTQYYFSNIQLPITTANDSTFHYINLFENLEMYPNLYEDVGIPGYREIYNTKTFEHSLANGDIIKDKKDVVLIDGDSWKLAGKDYLRKVSGTPNKYELRSHWSDHDIPWWDIHTITTNDMFRDKSVKSFPMYRTKSNKNFLSYYTYATPLKNGEYLETPYYYGFSNDHAQSIQDKNGIVYLRDILPVHSWDETTKKSEEAKKKKLEQPKQLNLQLTKLQLSQQQSTREKIVEGTKSLVKKVGSFFRFKNGGKINYLDLF